MILLFIGFIAGSNGLSIAAAAVGAAVAAVATAAARQG
jgi:hypothetical protein